MFKAFESDSWEKHLVNLMNICALVYLIHVFESKHFTDPYKVHSKLLRLLSMNKALHSNVQGGTFMNNNFQLACSLSAPEVHAWRYRGYWYSHQCPRIRTRDQTSFFRTERSRKEPNLARQRVRKFWQCGSVQETRVFPTHCVCDHVMLESPAAIVPQFGTFAPGFLPQTPQNVTEINIVRSLNNKAEKEEQYLKGFFLKDLWFQQQSVELKRPKCLSSYRKRIFLTSSSVRLFLLFTHP